MTPQYFYGFSSLFLLTFIMVLVMWDDNISKCVVTGGKMWMLLYKYSYVGVDCGAGREDMG